MSKPCGAADPAACVWAKICLCRDCLNIELCIWRTSGAGIEVHPTNTFSATAAGNGVGLWKFIRKS